MNFIFTTTAAEIQQENETRHWSIFVDESDEQTEAVKDKAADEYLEEQVLRTGDDEEVEIWRVLQSILRPARVVIPYAGWLARHTPNAPIRVRHDFRRLLALIETTALVHQRQRRTQDEDGALIVYAGLEDYYLAKVLVGDTFAAMARGKNAKVAELVNAVKEMEGPVTVARLARHLGKTDSTVRRWLKPAVNHGWVEEEEAAKGSKGAEYHFGEALPDAAPLPPVEELAEAFPELADGFSVIDPVTGEEFQVRIEEVAGVQGT